MKIGITGGSGFIGGYVTEVAIARGHSVVVLDPRGRCVSNHDAPSVSIERRLGDVRDSTDMTELAAHVDGIIHLAACLGTQETIQNPRPAAETNIVGGLNFLEACTQYGIPGVYIGVGNHWMDNTYSISKTTVERFVRMFNAERKGRFNTVRLVNAYGPRQSVAPPYGPAKVRKIMPAFICRALTGDDIEIYGDGSQISDMVFVRDGAEALVRSLEAAAEGTVFDRPVEVGPSKSATVKEVAEQVRAATNELWELRAAPKSDGTPHVQDEGWASNIVYLPMRPGETVGTPVTADTDTLELVGMQASDLVPLSAGISETVEWYLDNWYPSFIARDDHEWK